MKNYIVRTIFIAMIVFGWFIIPTPVSAANTEVYTIKTCSIAMNNVDVYVCFVGVTRYDKTDVFCLRKDSRFWRDAMRLREGDRIIDTSDTFSNKFEFEYIQQNDDPCVQLIK